MLIVDVFRGIGQTGDMSEQRKIIGTDRKHLTEQSYKTNERLNVRIRTHELYTEPKVDFIPWVLRHMAWRGDERVIDVGCGAGVYAAKAQKLGSNYIACDLSFGMVAGVKNASQKVNLDVQQLPFAAGTADVILANHMLYHVPDKPQALAEIARVLRPGGTLLAATNSWQSMGEMKALMREATRRLGIELDDPYGTMARHFKLEDGAEILRPFFDTVERHDREAALVFREAQPIVDYLASSNDWFEEKAAGRATWADVEPILWEMLEAHFAEHETFRVNKLSGVFVCRTA